VLHARPGPQLLSSLWSVRHALLSVLALNLLPAGDLLRAEQIRQGSKYGQLIGTNIREGRIVPSYITLKLIEIAMIEALQEKAGEDDGWNHGHGRFLIDGFPRNMDQAELFDDTVSLSQIFMALSHSLKICLSTVTLFYDTTEEILTDRLLGRAKTSGREDDNIESILKRFRTYKEETMPVIEHYQSQNKIIKVGFDILITTPSVVSVIHRLIVLVQSSRSLHLLSKSYEGS